MGLAMCLWRQEAHAYAQAAHGLCMLRNCVLARARGARRLSSPLAAALRCLRPRARWAPSAALPLATALRCLR